MRRKDVVYVFDGLVGGVAIPVCVKSSNNNFEVYFYKKSYMHKFRIYVCIISKVEGGCVGVLLFVTNRR